MDAAIDDLFPIVNKYNNNQLSRKDVIRDILKLVHTQFPNHMDMVKNKLSDRALRKQLFTEAKLISTRKDLENYVLGLVLD